MPDGRGSSSGPLVARGKVIQGMGGCSTYSNQKCFISAYDAATGKQLWKFNTVANDGEAGGDTWGKLSTIFRAGGETWITGSYDPELNLTYWGTAQAKPWMPVKPRHATRSTRRSIPAPPSRSTSTPASWRGTSSTRPAKRWISTSCSSACSSTPAARTVFTAGKDGILWKLDRKTGKYLGHKETVFQNVWE